MINSDLKRSIYIKWSIITFNFNFHLKIIFDIKVLNFYQQNYWVDFWLRLVIACCYWIRWLLNWVKVSVTTRFTVDWVNRVITRFVFQETYITLPKLEQRGHQLFNVTHSVNSQTKHLTKTQDDHTILYKFDITNTTK